MKVAVRPFDWIGELQASNAKVGPFDLQWESELSALADFLDHDEWWFAHEWWSIMAFAIDEVQDERVIVV